MKNEPSLKEWRTLYEAAMRVKKIAPWDWMDETDIFGVQNPETDETGFVSVMGAGGEHFAIGVYLGPRALYGKAETLAPKQPHYCFFYSCR